MSTPTSTPKPWWKTPKGIAIIVAVLAVIGLIAGLMEEDDPEPAAAPPPTSSVATSEEVTPEETTTTETVQEEETAPVEDDGPANLADGVDPEMGPQEWWDERYRGNNCVSQSIAHGGIATCMARGTDMDNDNTMLVFYVDQDEAGVQDHFSVEQRQTMFVDSLAGIVGAARAEGDPRVQHVTDVRVIATGGEGMFSGWQGETAVL